MIKLTLTDTLELLCKHTKKWGIFISFNPDDDYNEVIKAAPYLSFVGEGNDCQIIADGYGFLLFDTEEEMENAYNKTVGDDGPTELNLYKGPAHVYALTCDPTGQTMNENT